MMRQLSTPLFDYAESQRAKESSLALVAENAGPWTDDARAYLKKWCAEREGHEVTGEDVRLALTQAGLVPHHPNAWGSLIRIAVKDGLLGHSGNWRPMQAVKSHGRMTPVYTARAIH